jgi:hypothetical protein
VDAEVQTFLEKRFVPVWIDDKKDDMFAAKVGLSQEGYPNVAMYDGEGEYLGRVIGFGGRDPWFENVKDTWSVSEALAGAKASASKDPAGWSAVAALLDGIAGREKDALGALEKVPEGKRSAEFSSLRASYAAKAGWADVERSIRKTMSGVKNPEEAKAAAPKVLEQVETWLGAHGGANAKLDPAVWARKGYFLVLADRKPEAAKAALKILSEWPESPQAQAILRAMR